MSKTNDAKEKLIELYKSKQHEFKSIVETFPDEDLAGPFLMSPNEKYFQQKNKLLIIGQESCGWSYFVDDIGSQMGNYEQFNLGIDYYPSPFWNITRKVETALGNELYSCAWTNLNKFDLDSGRPYGEHLEQISKLDYILVNEMEIIAPKICLFYTGPSFDERLSKIFDGIIFQEIEGWSIRQFCKLIHPKLPKNSFRSYHPKSLRIRYLEDDFIDYMNNL